MRIDPETLILRALLDGEAYATQIIERIEELSDGKLTICMGTIQPALVRMHRDGLIGRSERDPEDSEPKSGRRRLYYWLTLSDGWPQAKYNAKIAFKFFAGGLS